MKNQDESLLMLHPKSQLRIQGQLVQLVAQVIGGPRQCQQELHPHVLAVKIMMVSSLAFPEGIGG